jgi:hypothetical protein
VVFRPSIPYSTMPVAVLARSRSTLVTPRLRPFGAIWAPLRTVDRPTWSSRQGGGSRRWTEPHDPVPLIGGSWPELWGFVSEDLSHPTPSGGRCSRRWTIASEPDPKPASHDRISGLTGRGEPVRRGSHRLVAHGSAVAQGPTAEDAAQELAARCAPCRGSEGARR